MTYVIAEPCVDVKDKACIEECPVDCIYEGARMLYIHPDECVDCGACEPVCPVEAIYYEDDVPDQWSSYTQSNADFFNELGSPGGASKVGMTENDPQVVKDILNLRQGLVIISGITGSGKSTTIASILEELNRTAKMRVITLEDPVEYVMKADQCLISQREVGKDCRTFAGGLRSALREDPDVVFVGEVRDIETASLALSAAETGHLVVTTLHTRDAAGVISRIVDLFPAERNREIMSQLSFGLAYVIAQKLVPKADGSGRVPSFEILKNVPSIGNLIRTGNWHQIYATMQLAAKERMMTMEKHLQDLMRRGVITREMALRYANDASQIQTDKNAAITVR